jgi:septal ring factor EnvC (AmiA/AmiB activator)
MLSKPRRTSRRRQRRSVRSWRRIWMSLGGIRRGRLMSSRSVFCSISTIIACDERTTNISIRSNKQASIKKQKANEQKHQAVVKAKQKELSSGKIEFGQVQDEREKKNQELEEAGEQVKSLQEEVAEAQEKLKKTQVCVVFPHLKHYIK